MAEFKLPELGENIESGDIVNVLVAEGDAVKIDQNILEIEAGKATMEIPSTIEGTITKLHVKAGDTVDVGQLIFEAEAQAGAPAVEAAPNAEAAATPAPEAAPKPIEEKKAEEPAPQAPLPPKAQVESAAPKKAVSAAPNVRRLARELGVDIHEVSASKPGGRISMEDVKNHTKRLVAGQVRGGAGGNVRPSLEHARPLPDFNKFGSIRREKMSQVRKATMEHLTHAWVTIPHVTQHDMADITKLEELRKRFAPKAEAAGAKLTVTAVLVKVVAAALKVFPKFNCSIDPATEEILYKEYYNVGIAVDTEKGLIVPVINDADKKNMVAIAQDLGAIAKKARDGKISMADLQGGTFTITNLGGIGGSYFTPIVNAPEVAILGVGKAIMDPCIGGSDRMCAPRLRMPLSLSYDHRIIDGADGARFLRWIVEAIEEPMLISLEG